jgi:aminoglycoside phosphotransferase (APT) family kinase protein
VLDWEVATLGDPLADLAYLVNRWNATPASALEGYFSADEMVARYAAGTRARVDNLDYYIAFNHWKSACIVHGVYTRYVRGQKAADGVDLNSMRDSIGRYLDQAELAAEQLA